MRSRTTVAMLAFAFVLATPASAYALTTDAARIVPDWLSIAAGAVGLGIAVLLLVDAVLLRRVAEGSMIADNIAYMMSGVVCFAASVLARWAAIFSPTGNLTVQMSWASDLLVTAGMALLSVYFMRVRFAMTRYLKNVAAAYPGASDPSVADSGAQGKELGG